VVIKAKYIFAERDHNLMTAIRLHCVGFVCFCGGVFACSRE